MGAPRSFGQSDLISTSGGIRRRSGGCGTGGDGRGRGVGVAAAERRVERRGRGDEVGHDSDRIAVGERAMQDSRGREPGQGNLSWAVRRGVIGSEMVMGVAACVLCDAA
jgi:hypothetical protein